MNVDVHANIFLLEQTNIPLNEVNIDSIKNVYHKLNQTDKKRAHKAALNKISLIFGEEFGNFIIRSNKFKRFNKGLDLVKVIQLAKKDNSKALTVLEQFIVNNMMDFYLSKLDKKFLKASLTGNRIIDESYKAAFRSFILTPKIKELLKDQVSVIIDNKADDIFDHILNEEGNKLSIKKRTRKIRDIFSSKTKRLKYQIIDEIFDTFTGVNKDLKLSVKEQLANEHDANIISWHENITAGNKKLSYIVNILSQPVSDYIRNKIFAKHFNDSDFKGFKIFIINVLNDTEFDKMFKRELFAKYKLSQK